MEDLIETQEEGRMPELTALLIGLGLSATCGFRVFVPLLGISIAHHCGVVDFGPGTAWIGSLPATICFGVAAIIEIAAYYVPWVDNLLDTIATPTAVIAGILVTAAMLVDMSPLTRWGLATIAGGTSAAAVQASTVALRATSAVTTGGLGNPLVSTGELVASIIGTITALLVPVVACVLILVALAFIIVVIARIRRRLVAPVAA